jgi:peptide deformylase
MTSRTIVTLPEPILRRKARPVTQFDRELQTLIDDMIETMRAAPGVGLAAPQVDVSTRLIVVEYAEEEPPVEAPLAEAPGEPAEPALEAPPPPKPKLYVMANPEIVRASEETVTGVEGCLSIPDLVGELERNETVHIRAFNRHGRPMKLKATGWLARIFQHEIDHLNGVLFTDRATRVWRPEPEEVELEERV